MNITKAIEHAAMWAGMPRCDFHMLYGTDRDLKAVRQGVARGPAVRVRKVVDARRAVCWLLWELHRRGHRPKWSSTRIAQMMRLDHTSVLYLHRTAHGPQGKRQREAFKREGLEAMLAGFQSLEAEEQGK
jgi:hypothetical protein